MVSFAILIYPVVFVILQDLNSFYGFVSGDWKKITPPPERPEETDPNLRLRKEEKKA